MEHHNQVVGILYRSIFAEYKLETPRSKGEPHPKVVKIYRVLVGHPDTNKMVEAK